MINESVSTGRLELIQERFHHATWVDGTAAQLGIAPSNLQTDEGVKPFFDSNAVFARKGRGTRFELKRLDASTGDFVVHFPVATQNRIPDQRLSLHSVMLDYRLIENVVINKVEVWDGNRKLASFADPILNGDQTLRLLELVERPVITRGINISLALDVADPNSFQGIVEFYGAGINMISKTQQVLANDGT